VAPCPRRGEERAHNRDGGGGLSQGGGEEGKGGGDWSVFRGAVWRWVLHKRKRPYGKGILVQIVEIRGEGISPQDAVRRQKRTGVIVSNLKR